MIVYVWKEKSLKNLSMCGGTNEYLISLLIITLAKNCVTASICLALSKITGKNDCWILMTFSGNGPDVPRKTPLNFGDILNFGGDSQSL